MRPLTQFVKTAAIDLYHTDDRNARLFSEGKTKLTKLTALGCGSIPALTCTEFQRREFLQDRPVSRRRDHLKETIPARGSRPPF